MVFCLGHLGTEGAAYIKFDKPNTVHPLSYKYNGNNVATHLNLQPKPLAQLMIHELCPHILINNSQNTLKKNTTKKKKSKIQID